MEWGIVGAARSGCSHVLRRGYLLVEWEWKNGAGTHWQLGCIVCDDWDFGAWDGGGCGGEGGREGSGGRWG